MSYLRFRGQVDGPRSDIESEVVKVKEEVLGDKARQGSEVRRWRKSEVQGKQSGW